MNLKTLLIVHSSVDISDTLSTSTVSRIEEVARMRDIDDSFEEKYNKLRSIAVRLKKKISEQTKRIEELESTNASTSEVTELTGKATNDAPLRNLQQLQKQNDTLQDELEAIRAADKQHTSQVESLTQKLTEVTAELAAMKLVNADIKSTADASSSQKTNLDQAIKEYMKQIASLKDELAAAKKENQAVIGDCAQLKGNSFDFVERNHVLMLIYMCR